MRDHTGDKIGRDGLTPDSQNRRKLDEDPCTSQARRMREAICESAVLPLHQ